MQCSSSIEIQHKQLRGFCVGNQRRAFGILPGASRILQQDDHWLSHSHHKNCYFESLLHHCDLSGIKLNVTMVCEGQCNNQTKPCLWFLSHMIFFLLLI